jgi:outer membrane protein assembly factor BamA
MKIRYYICIYILVVFGQAGLRGSDSTRTDMTIFEPLPIVSYDTDIGFGYGAKAFLLNAFHSGESFDLILFNSTKGERYYSFVFSVPDFELRQGTQYTLALDLIIEYDKYIARSFFGIGNSSEYEDREKYTRRDLEISPIFTSGISERVVVQAGYRYKSIVSNNFETGGAMAELPQDVNTPLVVTNSAFVTFRYDSRNSYINPDSGNVFLGRLEGVIGTVNYLRWAAWIQNYRPFIFQRMILALRFGLETLTGHDLPLQVLLPAGGSQSLRGYPQDRFLDEVRALANIELRFPIFGRVGGMAGFDFGKVWSSLSLIDLKNWPNSPVLGLRYYFRTYIVRLDVGFSNEQTGFYFNFGHLF